MDQLCWGPEKLRRRCRRNLAMDGRVAIELRYYLNRTPKLWMPKTWFVYWISIKPEPAPKRRSESWKIGTISMINLKIIKCCLRIHITTRCTHNS